VLIDAYRHVVRLHAALQPYFLSTAATVYYHLDLHLWATKHTAAAAATTPAAEEPRTETQSAASDHRVWNALAHSPHPPFYPLARDVAFGAVSDFRFMVGRDLFVVPIVSSALPHKGALFGHREAHDGMPTPLHEIDSVLLQSSTALVSFVTPPSGRWVDPTDMVTVYEPGTRHTAERNATAGPVVLVRAGSILVLGPEAGSTGWQPHPQRVSAGSAGTPATVAYSSDVLLGLPMELDVAAISRDRLVILALICPTLGFATDEQLVRREHDGDVRVTTRVLRTDSGRHHLFIGHTGLAIPLLLSIRGVRCVVCSVPEGYRYLPPDEFARTVSAASMAAVSSKPKPQNADKLATFVLREPTSTVLLYDPDPENGAVNIHIRELV
jgi:hypothetical protein